MIFMLQCSSLLNDGRRPDVRRGGTMKSTIGLLLFTALAGMAIRYQDPGQPKGITVKAPTEQSIKEEVTRERRTKAYQNASRAAAQVLRHNGCSARFAEDVGRTAVDYGISSRILAALVFVESSCNPNATSTSDSVGLTQVNPKVWHYSRSALRNPQRNLEIGAGILSGYVKRYGLVEGLHAYNGFGNPTDEYSRKVLTAAGIQVS
jgi:soluble lytic murein transglycosylase-like protein